MTAWNRSWKTAFPLLPFFFFPPKIICSASCIFSSLPSLLMMITCSLALRECWLYGFYFYFFPIDDWPRPLAPGWWSLFYLVFGVVPCKFFLLIKLASKLAYASPSEYGPWILILIITRAFSTSIICFFSLFRIIFLSLNGVSIIPPHVL